MTDPFFPIERLRLFATDGQVYRAFDHLIAARMGTLLLVPLHLVTGRCDALVDGCPVPWEELHAVIEYPSVRPLTNPDKWNGTDDHVQQLEYLGIDPSECVMDFISPLVNGEEKVLRLMHPCGVRYAVVVN
jgi:hypothetical protein